MRKDLITVLEESKVCGSLAAMLEVNGETGVILKIAPSRGWQGKIEAVDVDEQVWERTNLNMRTAQECRLQHRRQRPALSVFQCLLAKDRPRIM